MAISAVARVGASAGLVIIVLAGIVLAGGSMAAVLLATVEDTPAAEQSAAESADVELLRCGQDLSRMTAGLRVVNRSSGPSDYFIDLEFVRGTGAEVVEVVEVVTVVIEDVQPGVARRAAVVSTVPPPARFDCRVGDVDRLAA